ncbi:hypothetical protein HPB52_016584 [Rhipicephalus sanguineus]|uniref:CWF19-like protein 2 n=1 Tax=Rhipicephalus sanguineus TaxID=34632 RepID=A0A9D4Q7F0_RHISA|nr:hypothetical protein HPB52_016584 [Rhipicephalus sanguineus]
MSSQQYRQRITERREEARGQPGQHERELNPYWKEGGIGLPKEDEAKAAEPTLAASAVGDGGLRWLKRAYQRIREQAADESRPLEEVAAERYGTETVSHQGPRSGLKNVEDSSEQVMTTTTLIRTATLANIATEGSTHHKQDEQKQDISNKGRDCLQEERRPPRQQESASPCEQPKREKEPDSFAQREERAAPKLLSDKELNALGAKLIKAEMLGNTALYEKLKNEIEEARKARESVGASTCPDGAQRGSREEVVILTKTDGRGFAHPLSEPSEVSGPSRKKAKVPTHDRGGERVRYFADDDRHSLKNLFEREKMTTAEDQNAEFARLAGKVRVSKSQDYDFDDAVMDKASQHDSSAKQDARDRMKAIQEHKHMSKALEKCRYCLDSREMKKHLIIAIGIRAYLCLPPYQSLTEGHCLIVPQAHVACGTLLDEDVWLEVQVFRKGLTKMFEEMGKDTVFMETAVAFHHHPHAVIECIPVPMDIGNLAPMYFKKAIMECESEWAQNKKLVDLSKKGLRNSIPRGLPYFSVDFGLQGGFAHVVEDEKDFPVYFGKEVVGGMLDSEPRLWLKQQHESFDEQKKKVLEFTKRWEPYDWTERLKTE